MAGSVVVPDFEMMLREISLPSMMSIMSARYVALMELPQKRIRGLFLTFFDAAFAKEWPKSSITARAPKYEPPIPITMRTSESLLIF